MPSSDLKPGAIISGIMFPEPVQIIVTQPIGSSLKIIGRGLRTGQVREAVLSEVELAAVVVSPEREPFDGDGGRFRLGIEALRLALAHEYDPYFSLSIARVDPLPHQLEAVYDYFLALPRIRFLLADDPGAGKTIMAGLLLKELKARGLVDRGCQREPPAQPVGQRLAEGLICTLAKQQLIRLRSCRLRRPGWGLSQLRTDPCHSRGAVPQGKGYRLVDRAFTKCEVVTPTCGADEWGAVGIGGTQAVGTDPQQQALGPVRGPRPRSSAGRLCALSARCAPHSP